MKCRASTCFLDHGNLAQGLEVRAARESFGINIPVLFDVQDWENQAQKDQEF